MYWARNCGRNNTKILEKLSEKYAVFCVFTKSYNSRIFLMYITLSTHAGAGSIQAWIVFCHERLKRRPDNQTLVESFLLLIVLCQ